MRHYCCGLCKRSFSLDVLPLININCGHTFCKNCVVRSFEMLKFFKCEKCGIASDNPSGFIYNKILVEDSSGPTGNFFSNGASHFFIQPSLGPNLGGSQFVLPRGHSGAAGRSQNCSKSPGSRNMTRRKGSKNRILPERTLHASDFTNHFATKGKGDPLITPVTREQLRKNRFVSGLSKVKRSKRTFGRSLSQTVLRRRGISSKMAKGFSKHRLLGARQRIQGEGDGENKESNKTKREHVFDSRDYRNVREGKRDGANGGRPVIRSRNVTPNKSKLKNRNKSKIKRNGSHFEGNKFNTQEVDFEKMSDLFRSDVGPGGNFSTQKRKKFFELTNSPGRVFPNNFRSAQRPQYIDNQREIKTDLSQFASQSRRDLGTRMSPNEPKFFQEFSNMGIMNLGGNRPSFSERPAQSMISGEFDFNLPSNGNSLGFDKSKMCNVRGCNKMTRNDFCSKQCSQIWYRNMGGQIPSINNYDQFLKSQQSHVPPMFGQVSSNTFYPSKFGNFASSGFVGGGFSQSQSDFMSSNQSGKNRNNFFHKIIGE